MWRIIKIKRQPKAPKKMLNPMKKTNSKKALVKTNIKWKYKTA